MAEFMLSHYYTDYKDFDNWRWEMIRTILYDFREMLLIPEKGMFSDLTHFSEDRKQYCGSLYYTNVPDDIYEIFKRRYNLVVDQTVRGIDFLSTDTSYYEREEAE